MELNEKQKEFARQYLIVFTGTQAATRAGYSKSSDKVTAAGMLTCDNLQNS